jgi:hypothetical protein
LRLLAKQNSSSASLARTSPFTGLKKPAPSGVVNAVHNARKGGLSTQKFKEMTMNTNQAIARRSLTNSFTFTDKPTEQTREALIAAGYQFDGKSKQWYRRDEEAGLATEETIAQQLAA